MVTLILAHAPATTIVRDRVAFPRLRDQVRDFEARTGHSVKIANA
jgi:hypothetical protein